MLKELKFVMGAVSKKDFIPTLTHFKIENYKVRSFNGTLALCSPIALDIDCIPKAEPLVKAIQQCDETVSLTLTPTGKLSVKSAGFRALIDCVETETPHVTPEGDRFEINGEALLKALQTLIPLIGNDASRPWSNGALFLGNSVFATNNIILAEYWIGTPFPLCCNVPRSAIKEMVRIGEPPIWAQATDHSITFHYSDERWIRTTLLDTKWPDVTKILNVESAPIPFDERIYEGLEKLKYFTDKLGRVYFRDAFLLTHLDEGEGASYFIPDLHNEGIFQIEMLYLLKGIAKSIDWSLYPSPCMFFGDSIRGAIIGMRA